MGFGGDGDDVKIKGVDATGESREIAAEQDAAGKWRLLTKAESNIAVVEKPHHFVDYLKNAGSKSMKVDGSVTPVVFSIGPASGITWYVYELQILISDLKVDSRTRFGDISPSLTNGLLCESKVNATSRTIFNLQDNIDTAIAFEYEISTKTDAALANEDALFVGNLRFNNVIALNGTDGDLIQTTVRDNLTGLDALRITIKAYLLT